MRGASLLLEGWSLFLFELILLGAVVAPAMTAALFWADRRRAACRRSRESVAVGPADPIPTPTAYGSRRATPPAVQPLQTFETFDFSPK